MPFFKKMEKRNIYTETHKKFYKKKLIDLNSRH